MSNQRPIRHLILGGAKSGKSRYAQTEVSESLRDNKNAAAVYIATAACRDSEMASRIDHHQVERRNQSALSWQTIEAPIQLGDTLVNLQPDQPILIDCLTLWLTQCLEQQCWDTEKTKFLSALETSSADIFIVSNEVSLGIVPLGELSRRFIDEIGVLHQELATLCDQVTLMVAGLATQIKSNT